MKNVAIVIQNNVQFLSMKNYIDEMIRNHIQVDIYVPEGKQIGDGFPNMFNDIYSKLKKDYNVYREIQKNKTYKILFEPYPVMPIKANYKIKYKYSAMSAKPNKVYRISESFLPYDLILCHSKIEQNTLSVYSKTQLIGNCKFNNFKKHSHSQNKPILVYLPTYGQESSINEIIPHLKKIRQKYYLIIKVHHGTNFLDSEKEKLDKVKDECDEFYDSHKELSDLLEVADIVLSDNSGAIFESLYAKTPVAVFSKDINQNKWGDFNTFQYDLYKQGILPYTANPNDILKILSKTLEKSTIKKQQTWSDENFYYSDNSLAEFMEIINNYLTDNVDQKWLTLHREFFQNYNDLLVKSRNEKEQAQAQLIALRQEILKLSAKNAKYENAKLHRLANKIYKFFGKE